MSVAAGPVLTLLVNPSSGHGRASRRLPWVRGALEAALPRVRTEVAVSADYAHARALADRAVASASEGDALVVMGGDGMASVGHNACAGSGVALGVVPAGTGNDFCRGVGLPTTIRDAVRAIAAGRTRTIDLMHCSGTLVDGTSSRYVGSVLSTGFDEKVNWRANTSPLQLGAPSYAWSIFMELKEFRPLRYRLVVDGSARALDSILVAVGNAGVFGGGMRVCPDADVADGRLDVTIVHPVGRGTLMQLLPRIFTGTFVAHPCVETLRATEVHVDGDGLYAMADGENLGRTPIDCRVQPGALRVFSHG